MMIKVCGLTRLEDVLECDKLGVDFLGFIFFKDSPRCVNKSLFYKLPKLKAKKVGVFVDKSLDEIKDIVKTAGLDYVQLHGDYSYKECEELEKDRVIKVMWPERYTCLEDFQKDVLRFKDVCSYFLVDSGHFLGGHGRNISCEWLKRVWFPKKWFLAGGIGPKNFLKLINHFSPNGIDLSSCVEIAPGKKDILSVSYILKKVK